MLLWWSSTDDVSLPHWLLLSADDCPEAVCVALALLIGLFVTLVAYVPPFTYLVLGL